jgi:putative endonuclease
MLQLSDTTIYTGYTKNIDNRLMQHSKGVGSKYVRSRLPLSLAYIEHYDTRSAAMRREIQIKKYSRIRKLKMIEFYTNGS